MEEKKYGLIRLSKTDKPKTTLKKNIFESDSDEETESTSKKISTSSGVKRQTQLDITRALTEDPNVFEYDSIYDDMKSKKESVVAIDLEAKEKPKPKYINNLLKFAEKRNKENERRVERKIQKERESEGNKFEDKEQFVTNAYKQKMIEMKAADELERRQEAIEELLDVTKQKDLSGFYRHLLNGDISSQTEKTLGEVVPPKEVTEEDVSKNTKSIPKPKTNRQIRRRMSSSSEESSEETVRKETPKVVKKEKSDEELSEGSDSESEVVVQSTEGKPLNDKTDEKQQKISDIKEDSKQETNSVPKLSKREILIKIFTKRTVGETFSEAQMRYFQRKDNYVI